MQVYLNKEKKSNFQLPFSVFSPFFAKCQWKSWRLFWASKSKMLCLWGVKKCKMNNFFMLNTLMVKYPLSGYKLSEIEHKKWKKGTLLPVTLFLDYKYLLCLDSNNYLFCFQLKTRRRRLSSLFSLTLHLAREKVLYTLF